MPAAIRGDKAKADALLAAIELVNQLESEQREPTKAERQTLLRFGGFGAVALGLFADPITGQYKDEGWRHRGERLRSLLSDLDYDSAKRTTFNAFYTSPVVMQAMHDALGRLGVPQDGVLLEPGCGIGNFMALAGPGQQFIGVELDRTSGRIAKALYPNADIRIENFRDTVLPAGQLDGVIGNVPFASIPMRHGNLKCSLHDYFFAKPLDALKPNGILALVTSRFTLDKQNGMVRRYLSDHADFLGAIRLPSEAFKDQGTNVVTDIVLLRKREAGQEPSHVDPRWVESVPMSIEGNEFTINQYFQYHPEMVLGEFSRDGHLYRGNEGFSVQSNGVLKTRLGNALNRLLPESQISEVNSTLPVAKHFVRPPPDEHIGEGSFVVGDDRSIRQVVGGMAVPVCHGKNTLRADGSLLGKRLAALIDLRDAARLLLQSQNQSWPEDERRKLRVELNRRYDGFARRYGPINKTTFSQTRTGSVIRRMPNLVKFRADPDAMLVMSLEDYDEVTEKASKAAILIRDVVGPQAPIDVVATAEEALLVSLDRRGRVELPFMAMLYDKPEDEIATELGDLVYLDPDSNEWQTADVYLSGNVRAKLAIARDSGEEYHRNVRRLEEVQPPDVLPGDIDAKLGAPWIPPTDIQAFAAELFRVAPSDVAVEHLPVEATWDVEGSYAAKHSVSVTSEFGTERIGGISLLEQALNMKTPVVYDIIRLPDRDERVLNQDATLAAREKQKQIKGRFESWVFADPDRAERLVRIYNDLYNCERPRLFDGEHLAFPGLNQEVTLRPHQKDAVWRIISSGNTLLAHVVGAGKTFTMAAAGMKLKETGLARKPMFVVPNHMLEQFSREFMQLYPNARLLVAGKEDLSRDRRKHLTAKIATGEWDGVVVTHSSFERIGMSPAFQQRFLSEQIADYDTLLTEAAAADDDRKHRNLIKTIEKQKAAREEKLQQLQAAEKKDDGLVFDELGVDHVFIDEAQYFKNLEIPTKMNRVAGIQTNGSQRAFDLYMKARYLDEQHPGRGLTFATGTPISNTMVELYVMQKYLDPKGLEDRGISHFDAWAATFGEVIDNMEISPDGSTLRARSRFARFNNLPELQQLFRSFADVQTAGMLNLPRPELDGGKAQIVTCPMSDMQDDIQQTLVERYERIRSSKIDPSIDNALAITTDGRKLALDARLVDANADDTIDSKSATMARKIHQIWEETIGTRSTQIVFCDLGVGETPWGYSVYDDVQEKLERFGIPREEIARIGDANSDAKKQALFARVRSGNVRILLGSTQKMGTGTNVQKKLIALHHLDAPWKPAEVEQREGRILRQGNENDSVAIYRYVTEGSFDAFMWQALQTKASFIAQIMAGDSVTRRAEDVGGQELSFAEVKALASGNPAMLVLAEADGELQKLTVLRKSHMDQQFLARRRLAELPSDIDRRELSALALKSDGATVQASSNDRLRLGNGPVIAPADEVLFLSKSLERVPTRSNSTTQCSLGTWRGLVFGISINSNARWTVFLRGKTTVESRLASDSRGARAVLNHLDKLSSSYPSLAQTADEELRVAWQQLADFQEVIGNPFEFESQYSQLIDLRNDLSNRLSAADEMEAASKPTAQIVEQIKGLIKQDRESGSIVGTATQIEREEPMASRLRHLIASGNGRTASRPISPCDETPSPNCELSAAPINNAAQPSRDRV